MWMFNPAVEWLCYRWRLVKACLAFTTISKSFENGLRWSVNTMHYARLSSVEFSCVVGIMWLVGIYTVGFNPIWPAVLSEFILIWVHSHLSSFSFLSQGQDCSLSFMTGLIILLILLYWVVHIALSPMTGGSSSLMYLMLAFAFGRWNI